LGHLHKAQTFSGTPVHYSGSIVPLRSAEQSYRHSVNLVTLNGAEMNVERLFLPRLVPFLRLREKGDIPFEKWQETLETLALPADLSPHEKPVIHVQFARENLPAGFREEAERIAAQFPVRVVDIRVTPLVRDSINPVPQDALVRLAERKPE